MTALSVRRPKRPSALPEKKSMRRSLIWSERTSRPDLPTFRVRSPSDAAAIAAGPRAGAAARLLVAATRTSSRHMPTAHRAMRSGLSISRFRGLTGLADGLARCALRVTPAAIRPNSWVPRSPPRRRELSDGALYRSAFPPQTAREVMSPVEAGLLVDGALGPRDGREALVGDRLPALDRDAVRPLFEPLLGAADRREVVAQPVRQAGVALVLEELGPGVAEVLVDVRQLLVADPGQQPLDLLLDALARLGEQLSGAVVVH